jgi:hypothetical protein
MTPKGAWLVRPRSSGRQRGGNPPWSRCSIRLRNTVSGQLAKMRWGLDLNIPVPMCPFVAAYLRRHPEQRDLVVAT